MGKPPEGWRRAGRERAASIPQFTRNTLCARIRQQSVALLNRQLAMVVDLEAQARQARWCVRGPGVEAMRDLFGRVASAASAYADMLAGRASALGGIAEGTVQGAAAVSELEPYPLRIASGASHARAVADALAALGTFVRDAIVRAGAFEDADAADVFIEAERGDAATVIMLAEILRGIDELLWLVESHLEPVADAAGAARPQLETMQVA